MVTKEQCEQALRNLETINLDIVLDELGYEKAEQVSWYGMNDYPTLEKKGDIDVLRELIEEHFNNPPLTHEEIEEGKWYWHNKLKFWMKIINKDVCTEIFPVMENEDGYIYFEEDTYFRKEVQE